MQVSFGSDPARLVAAIGPCIGPCCYEVGEPVISAVKKTMEEPESLLILQPNGNRPHFDLPEANRQRLVAAGVEQVELSELCTACRTDLFYSHRAEKGRTGRFGALLLLAEE
jgi:copper oxidase (laccase) domain-containing protein